MKILFSHVKRRQLLLAGGAGVIGILGGGAATKAIDFSAVPAAQPKVLPQDDGPYLEPNGFDQHFLAKTAEIKQIWDFSSLTQLQKDGFKPVRNAIDAFQFVYLKSFAFAICLRGSAVIYAFDDAMWQKYRLGRVFGQSQENKTDQNPFYQLQASDVSLQELLQRGSALAVCQDALSGLAFQLGQPHEDVVSSISKELVAHLVPGAKQTPSGSSLIAVAQHFGFTYAKQ